MKSTTLLLLDKWKTQKGIESDNQAAIKLGVSRSALSRWRHGAGHADVPLAAKMADELHMDTLSILAAIEAERCVNRESQKIWARYGKAAFMSLLLSVAGRGYSDIQAKEMGALQNVTSHYAKSRKRPIRGMRHSYVSEKRNQWNESFPSRKRQKRVRKYRIVATSTSRAYS